MLLLNTGVMEPHLHPMVNVLKQEVKHKVQVMLIQNMAVSQGE
jgi:hypothetical protein